MRRIFTGFVLYRSRTLLAPYSGWGSGLLTIGVIVAGLLVFTMPPVLAWQNLSQGQGTAPTTLGTLTDMAIVTPSDNQTLIYQSSSGKWVNVTISSVSGSYSDVNARAALSCTATGLTYNSSTGATSLSSGYLIPTTTQSTNWNTAYTHSGLTTGNPHNVTKSDVGLGSVENTALSTWAGSGNITTLGTIGTGTWHGSAIGDSYISSAATWNAKQNALTAGTDYLAPSGNGSSLTGLTKSQVGLGSVENTALSTWAGTGNITTLGTISTGTIPWANISKTGSTVASITDTNISSPSDGDVLKYQSSTSRWINGSAGTTSLSSGNVDGLTVLLSGSKLSVSPLIVDNILLNSFRIATIGSLTTPYLMADGVTDDFRDTIGVNTGGSTYGAYDSSNYDFKSVSSTLLIQGEGSATAFVDTARQKTITATGNATQSATQYKLGSKSIYLDGTSSTYLSLANNSDWDFGSGNFTIDAWVYMATTTGGAFTQGANAYANRIASQWETGTTFNSNTNSQWSVYDTAAQFTSPASKGFIGAVFDGRYVYFVPYNNGAAFGQVTRYDTTGNFTTAGSWSVYDTTAVNSNSKGFNGAVFDGRYVYFVPYSNGAIFGQITRYDTTGNFTTAGSWSVYDTAAQFTSPASKGFAGAVFDGRYVYFVPNYNGAAFGQITRYDTTGNFTTAGSWSVYDTAAQFTSPASKGFIGAVFDGRYVYFVPYSNGAIFG
ncbi:MAG: hypothetical protein HQL03_11025, partial [Nitrospirae bacterium]|nr:hypothetical protein [Nitrospirota bacterium]